MHIKVMADYECWPLWWDSQSGQIGNIDPATLGLDPDLCVDLQKWAAVYDATLDHDYPPNSGFGSIEAESEFMDEGRLLAKRVSQQLSVTSSVGYWRNGELEQIL